MLSVLLPLLRVQGAELADDVDMLFGYILAITVFFTAAIFIGILFLATFYRRGRPVDRSNAPSHNDKIEMAWTIIPLGIALSVFAWSAVLYLRQKWQPKDALEIHVVGKQWMWKMQHPTGKWENNELHIPVGRSVKFTMTSEDVIHAFYVPEFRIKQDVIPGTFTQMSVVPTKTGVFRLYCAEFCGTLHSGMIGTVTVMEPGEYDAWLSRGNVSESVAGTGKRLFTKFGCNGCHGVGSSVRAPRLEGIYGRPGPVQVPKPGTLLEDTQATTVLKDARYIHDAIFLPEKEVAAGYKSIMPTYKNQMTEVEALQIIAYLKAMGSQNDPPSPRIDNTSNLSEADYRARVGFKPENLQKVTSPTSTREPGQESTYQPGKPGETAPPTAAPAPAQPPAEH